MVIEVARVDEVVVVDEVVMEAIAAAGKGRIFLTRGADFFALAPHAGMGVGDFRTARTAVGTADFGTAVFGRTGVLLQDCGSEPKRSEGPLTNFKRRNFKLQTANCETARLRDCKLQTANGETAKLRGAE